MDVNDIVQTIPRGSLRSYTWVAQQLDYEGEQAPIGAGRAIARETLRRWPTPAVESGALDADAFPWWRVIGLHGDVLTIREDEAWYHRQVARLEAEGHILVPSPEEDGLRVQRLPADFA